MRNHLVCWEENGIKKWEMITKKDLNGFLMELLQSVEVDHRTIFIIPTTMMEGIWLVPDSHKSNRVDFYHFFEDYGIPYVCPRFSEQTKKVVQELEEKHGPETKYGFVSPDGRYFHCDYQGHSTLAYNICFGLVDTNNAELYLEEHGWCKIYKPLGYRQYCIYIGENHGLTNEQVKTLIEMGLDAAEDFAKMLLRENAGRR